MDDQEDLRHLIQQNQEDLRHLIQQNQEDLRCLSVQNQRQFQKMQSQMDRLQAVVYSGSLGKDSHTDGSSSYCYRWRFSYETFLRFLTILGLIIGCGWNLREILQDMIESPTVTKMTNTFHDKLPLPLISVYQKSDTPMFHTGKLFKALENGSLTEAYLESIIQGADIGVFFERNITVQPSEIKEAYQQAILRYGSLTEAASALQREYGIACNELFMLCKDDLFRPTNCCDLFEFLWGLNGPQYSLKWNIMFLEAFHSFSIYLLSLPDMKILQKGDFVEEPGNFQSYWISISNGVDQSGIDLHTFEVQPSEIVAITLRQKRRYLKVSKDCIDLPPKLRYFRDYTINNCFVERCYLNKLSLCNSSCELPLLQLLNPGNLSGPPCGLDAMNSKCWDILETSPLQCSTDHGCRFPCNHTEVEYSVAKGLVPGHNKEIVLLFQYDTTEVQTFEETSRLTLWEYLGLISSILDLWLGITIYSLYRMLHRALSQITYSKSYDVGKTNSAAAHSASTDQQHEMANHSNR